MILKLCQEVQEIIRTPIVYWALIAGTRTYHRKGIITQNIKTQLG